MAPKLNRRRAMSVLEKIDGTLAWEQNTERERDTRFIELGRYFCEVHSGQCWRIDNLKSFDEFLEKKFPESRRKAYHLMAIHEQLPRNPQRSARNRVGQGQWSSEDCSSGARALRLSNLVAQSQAHADSGIQT
jgi:hypothetical protein